MRIRPTSTSRPERLDAGDHLEGAFYTGTLAALIGGAWLALGVLSRSPYVRLLSHDLTDGAGGWPLAARVAIFVGGWTVMSVAMMLPSSLPLVTVFRTITRGAPALLAALVAGYLLTWGLFGLLALAGDVVLHELVEASDWLTARTHLVSASLLLTAGLFQFSPLKHACLKRCRSPIGFVIQHWQGGRRATQALALGVHHGLFCAGCCWALMLLMFGVGTADMRWMLALGALMFVEKAVGWGRWITAPTGALLALWGLALFARVPGVPAPF
jgi:predicted metal-binding membrane protein